jgi:3'(2'), 5'-bisphosphate nucleotidase
MNKELLSIAILAALEAGKKIMEVYESEVTVSIKEDKSPLTEADKRAHVEIKTRLEPTGYPLLSEEGKMTPFSERQDWETFWLVDPLDGTKEFIKRNGEFTVNIALISSGVPVLGVVFLPVKRVIYFGTHENGSFSMTLPEAGDLSLDEIQEKALKLGSDNMPQTYTIVASRSHMSPETELFINEKKEKHGDIDLISSGSSIKLCLVAEGSANVYPRLAPTMEWDTAAAHAVAKFAGCKVYNYTTGDELMYNKENLLNPWFVVERI